jgi:hypothetical protein
LTIVSIQIYAKDAASADKFASTLGTGSGALDKINTELQKQGLEKSTGLDFVAAKSDNTGVIIGIFWLWLFSVIISSEASHLCYSCDFPSFLSIRMKAPV